MPRARPAAVSAQWFHAVAFSWLPCPGSRFFTPRPCRSGLYHCTQHSCFEEGTTVRNNRDENLASTTVADMKAVAQDMLRMGKHWTQAAQDWLDQRRDDMRDDRRQRRTRRGTRDFQGDYGGGGADQVDDTPGSRPYGDYGARGYRGVGPRNYRRSDERIREDLNDRLTEADDLDASDISVEVSNGVATLTGSVGHRWMKHRAEDLADECLGVRDV